MKDRETISQQPHELNHAANELGVPTWLILKAIADLQSNVRSEVYEYIRKQKEAPVEPDNDVVFNITPPSTSGKSIKLDYQSSELNDEQKEEILKVFKEQPWQFMNAPMKNKLNVIKWAEAKNLVKYENRFVQFAKVVEEIGELGKGLIKGDKELEKDSIGDSIVTLIILSAQLGLDIEDCLEHAYQEIKDRTGITNENGTFIKD